MPKRVAEETDLLGHYKAQVAELLSQQEGVGERSSDSAIGAAMSKLKRDHLNVLLRQCVKDLTPQLDEMQQRVMSLRLLSQMGKHCPPSSPTILHPKDSEDAIEDDIQLLMGSDPHLVKKITSQYSHLLHSKLENMQQQLDDLLDNVVNTCRPMTHSEKRDLEKSIKELPERNLKRVADIVGKHYTSGIDIAHDIVVDLDGMDNIVLWRLHFYVGAVKNAQKLAR